MIRFLHRRYSVIAAALIAMLCAWAYFSLGVPSVPAGMDGIVTAWSAPWIFDPSLNFVLAIGSSCLVAFLINFLNKKFNVLRRMTMLPGTLFLIMQIATPTALVSFYPGQILPIAVLCCFFLFFGSYDEYNTCQRHVFLGFLILSACASFDASNALFIPFLWLVCAQMRILSLRTILASLMGIATPWIILLGFKIISVEDLAFPTFFDFTIIKSLSYLTPLICAVVLTAAIGIAAWVQNVMKFLSYNAQSRAMLSMFTVALWICILILAIDISSLYSFLPLLNCLVAMQLGHVFGIVYYGQKSYIAILSLCSIYFMLYLWRFIMLL